MKCFYHDDLDGNAAAFCVHAWVGIKPPAGRLIRAIRDMRLDIQGVDFRAINYGTEFPFDDIIPNEQVWIVDYSIEPDEMRRLLEITSDVTWIDHHKTAIEKYADFPHNIRGIRKDGEAGCVLAWKYIHWNTQRGDGEERFGDMGDPCPYNNRDNMPVPRMIALVGDRDVWKWEYGEETRFFFAGSQLHDTSPGSKFWWKCMDHETKDLPPPNTGNRDARIRGEQWWAQLLRDGETVEKYKTQSDTGINESLGYDVTFEGMPCWAINRARVSSDRLGDRIKQYDILLPHYYDGKKWTVSLYSEKVDVSVIAKRYGGGGHKGASGFQCDVLPWTENQEQRGADVEDTDTSNA